MTKINETPSASNTGATPQIEAPPLAPAGVPLCFVVDEEATAAHPNELPQLLHRVSADARQVCGLRDGESSDEQSPGKLEL